MDILPVRHEHNEKILDLLSSFNDPRIGPPEWKRLFAYDWNRGCDPYGFAALVDGDVVGYLGTVFSYQAIDGTVEKCCNLTSWLVKPEYRTTGAFLLRELLELPDCTVTNLTCRPRLVPSLRAVGFELVDTHATVIHVKYMLWPRFSARKVRVVWDRTAMRQALQAPQRQIAVDHADYPCNQVALIGDSGVCHILYNLRKGRRFHLAWIQYVSDIEMFLSSLRSLAVALFLRRGIARILVENRWLQGWVPADSYQFPLANPRLIRPFRANPAHVFNCYSEMVMLDHV